MKLRTVVVAALMLSMGLGSSWQVHNDSTAPAGSSGSGRVSSTTCAEQAPICRFVSGLVTLDVMPLSEGFRSLGIPTRSGRPLAMSFGDDWLTLVCCVITGSKRAKAYHPAKIRRNHPSQSTNLHSAATPTLKNATLATFKAFKVYRACRGQGHSRCF